MRREGTVTLIIEEEPDMVLASDRFAKAIAARAEARKEEIWLDKIQAFKQKALKKKFEEVERQYQMTRLKDLEEKQRAWQLYWESLNRAGTDYTEFLKKGK